VGTQIYILLHITGCGAYVGAIFQILLTVLCLFDQSMHVQVRWDLHDSGCVVSRVQTVL
jgi:peptidoglycan biosynthesis protein MviN/MurJ (putative lipid II flippase)